MTLGTKVSRSQCHIVLDGDPAPPLWQRAHHPHFSTNVYYGQMAGWIRTPLGTKVSLGPGRHCVRWGPSSRHGKGHSSFMWFPPYFYSGVRIGASQKSLVAVFAIFCTRFRISRLLRSCLTLNDARQRYFWFRRNRK